MASGLARAVGERLRALREAHEVTQEQVAAAARHFGLDWSRDLVTALEGGKRDLTADELLMLPLVLMFAFGVDEFQTANLLPSRGWIGVGADARVRVDVLRRSLRGEATTDDFQHADVPISRAARAMRETSARLRAVRRATGFRLTPRQVRRADLSVGDAERRAVRALGADPDEAWLIPMAAYGLWRRSFTAERDARVEQVAPPGASGATLQALRGHATRRMLEELRPRIDEAREAWKATTEEGEER